LLCLIHHLRAKFASNKKAEPNIPKSQGEILL